MSVSEGAEWARSNEVGLAIFIGLPIVLGLGTWLLIVTINWIEGRR